MKPDNWYRHPNNTTICLEVEKSFYIKEKDSYSLRIAWYKWSPTRGIEYPLGIRERVKWTRQHCRNYIRI